MVIDRFISNAQISPQRMRKFCAISLQGGKRLENAITWRGLSARAHDRIPKVARTIADLDAAGNIPPRHVTKPFRTARSDRSYWA